MMDIRWIRVDDALPKDCQVCWATLRSGDVKLMVFDHDTKDGVCDLFWTVDVDENFNVLNVDTNYYINEVVAWIPIIKPEPVVEVKPKDPKAEVQACMDIFTFVMKSLTNTLENAEDPGELLEMFEKYLNTDEELLSIVERLDAIEEKIDQETAAEDDTTVKVHDYYIREAGENEVYAHDAIARIDKMMKED